VQCENERKAGYRSTPSVPPVRVVTTLVPRTHASAPTRIVLAMGVGDLILIVRRPEALRALQIRLWAGPTLQISITTDGGEVSCARGEVMRWQVNGEIVVIVARREGTMRAGATVAAEPFGHVAFLVRFRGRLPVDRLHAVLKGARWPELPLADNSPDDACGTNGGSNGDEDDDCVTLQLGDAARGGCCSSSGLGRGGGGGSGGIDGILALGSRSGRARLS
jgi:hypothetical protein